MNGQLQKPRKTAVRFVCMCQKEHYTLDPVLGHGFFCSCGAQLEVTSVNPPLLEEIVYYDDYSGADGYNDRDVRDYNDSFRNI